MTETFTPFVAGIADILALGGPVVALLIILSVFALALVLLKLFQFWWRGVGRHRGAETALSLWRAGQHDEAFSLCAASRSAISASLAAGMRMRLDGYAAPEMIENEATRVASGQLHELQKGFRALDAIAQIAPLLGLFGTVLGMIDAFQAMQASGSAVDPSVLAGGIWVALLTTAVGLAVAMPVSVLLTLLETRVENERMALEDIVTRWLNAQEEKRSARPQTAISDGGEAGMAMPLAHAR